MQNSLEKLGIYLTNCLMLDWMISLTTTTIRAFDAIILAIILVNCVFLALDNEIESAE